jgi:hypothetical protein
MHRWFGSFGSLAVEMFVRDPGIGAGGVDSAVHVLGRSVDGVKLERFRASADDVMARALWYDDPVIGLDSVARPIDPDLSFTGFDAEELIAVVMDFVADLVPRLNRHENKLKIISCVENTPKLIVFLGQFLDVVDKALHLQIPSNFILAPVMA